MRKSINIRHEIILTTIMLFCAGLSYAQTHEKPIHPNIKPGNYKVTEKGDDFIIHLGGKDYTLSGGAIYVDLDLSKEFVMKILSEKETSNTISWWSYFVGYKDLPLYKTNKPKDYSKPQDKPKWGKNRYRLDGFIGYVPGVGLVGRYDYYYSSIRLANGQRKQKPFSKDIHWIITETGELVLPQNSEYVRQSAGFVQPFLAERTFYGFGAEANFAAVPKNAKHFPNGGWEVSEKIEKHTGAYLFHGENIEKKWENLVDLKDGFVFSQYFQFDEKGFIQFGETLDSQAIIITMNPDLTVKSALGPVLMVHTFEGIFFSADAAQGERAPEDLGRMFLVENHDLAGVFSKLESDGSFYIPENSLGLQPLFSEVIYKNDNYYQAKYTGGEVSKKIFITYGFIVPYIEDNKFQWGVAQVSNSIDPKIDFTEVEKHKKPLYSEVEPFFSQKLRFHHFHDINPFMIFAKSIETGSWQCLTHKAYIPKEMQSENLEAIILYVEDAFIEIISNAKAKSIAAENKRKEEAKRRYEEWVKYDQSEAAAAERRARAERQRIASLPWSPIGGDRSQRWQGFSHSQQMHERYRKNVMDSAKTWPGTTKITTTYQNGKITGTSTSGAW